MQGTRRLLLRGAGLLAAAPIAGPALLASKPATAQDLPRLVARVRPSIVAVGSFNRLRSPQFRFRGTGFAIGDGNTIATCAHVLPELDPSTQEQLALAVPMDGGARIHTLSPVATNLETDLAVLRFTGPPLPALELAEPAEAAEGADVVLIGFPLGARLGLYPATHRGVIAAIAPMVLPGQRAAALDPKAVQRLRGEPVVVLQLDITAYPGNSGSPLIDARSGRVLGVVSMVTVKGARENAISAPSGISYALPVRHLVALASPER